MTAGDRAGAAEGAGPLQRYWRTMRLAEPVAAPLACLALGRNRGRWRERFGLAGPGGRSEPPLWLHGASLGETTAMLPLVDALRALGAEVLVTSQTATSADLLSRRLAGGVAHSYAPLDFPRCVERFVSSWRPRLLALFEGEVWPVTLSAASAASLPVVAINARLSERSHRRWRRRARLAAEVFGTVGLVLGADRRSRERLIDLGVRADAFEEAPELKRAADPLPADEVRLENLRRRLKGIPLWLAASTHPADERVVLEAQRRLRRTPRPPLLILVPRRPERGREVEARARAASLSVTRLSRSEDPGTGGDVHVADAVGELGLWYRLVDVALVGGSFGGEGGHNPLEAARLETGVLHGPGVENFADMYRDLDAAGGAAEVRNSVELAAALERMLDGGSAMAKAAGDAAKAPKEAVGGMARRILRAAGPLATGGWP